MTVVAACPDCDAAKVQPRKGEDWADDTDADYYCSDCGAYFDDLKKRTADGHTRGGSTMRAKLLNTDSEVNYE